MIANLWLVHLKEIFKQFTQAYDRLVMTRNSVQVAKIFTIESLEKEIAILFLIADVAEWSEIGRHLSWWNKAIWWIEPDYFIIISYTNYWMVRLALHSIPD